LFLELKLKKFILKSTFAVLQVFTDGASQFRII